MSWMSGWTAAGHRATRQPCGPQSRQITLGTAASPASPGVISTRFTPNAQTHTNQPRRPSSRHITSATRLSSPRCVPLAPSTTPVTPPVMTVPKPSSCRRVLSDWLRRPRSDVVCCLGYLLPFFFFQRRHVMSLPRQQGVKEAGA